MKYVGPASRTTDVSAKRFQRVRRECWRTVRFRENHCAGKFADRTRDVNIFFFVYKCSYDERTTASVGLIFQPIYTLRTPVSKPHPPRHSYSVWWIQLRALSSVCPFVCRVDNVDIRHDSWGTLVFHQARHHSTSRTFKEKKEKTQTHLSNVSWVPAKRMFLVLKPPAERKTVNFTKNENRSCSPRRGPARRSRFALAERWYQISRRIQSVLFG